MNEPVRINRLEIIDHTETGNGRDYIKWEDQDFYASYDFQDDDKTLKIFLKETPED